jgi:fibronectin-binding autotransporter adhesin
LFDGVNRNPASVSSGLATDMWGDWTLPMRLGAWMLRPRAGLRYAQYGSEAWTESGADALALSANAQSVRSAQGDLGVGIARARGRVRPNVSATFRRELTNGETRATLQLSDQPDGQFVVNGIDLARETVTTRAGLTFAMDHLSLSLGYDARYAPGQRRQAFRFNVQF